MEHERKTRTAESNSRADPHPKKVTPYKEYAACKEAEGRVSTTSKPTLEEEENWDEEPHCHLVKLCQELNLWCNLKKTNGS